MCSTKYLDVIKTMAASVYRQIPHILSFIEILRKENKIYTFFLIDIFVRPFYSLASFSVAQFESSYDACVIK